MSKSDLALVELYELLTRKSEGCFTSLDGEQRRAYFREAKRQSRHRQKAACASGSPAPTAANIRTALADAALMILAIDGPGAAQIETVLGNVFVNRPGVAMATRARATTGRLKPLIAKVRL